MCHSINPLSSSSIDDSSGSLNAAVATSINPDQNSISSALFFSTNPFNFSPLQTFTTTQSFSPTRGVSADIASRQARLERHRQKRLKRNWNRPSDSARRERACARQRDEFGHFLVTEKKTASNSSIASSINAGTRSTNSDEENDLNEVKQMLEFSQKESQELKRKLSLVFEEMMVFRKKAEDARVAKELIAKELEQQQQVNRALIQENHMLWSTVPLNEIFSTIRAPSSPTHSFINIDAFKEKIDLANIQLNWTDSPHLEAARVEEEEFQKRWDEMNFIAGGEKSV
jgi:hypothetical protein